ncbi:MAG: hypothetical protein OEM97_02100 [Acidimicrobiia bacterium]|nr:hypothetical protein [Acidimicrobiia bacterium]
MRGQIERSAPPRALYAELPLGRPLGKPNDAAYQKKVMMAAFDLLKEESGPVLVEFPDVVEDESAEALVCAVPPRFNPDLHPAIDEAQGIRAAYNRTVEDKGVTSVGRAESADDIPAIIEAFINIGNGVSFKEAGMPGGDVLAGALDIRSYYEEAAQSLADHVPGARQVDTWIYQETAVGKVMHAAQKAMSEVADIPRPLWFFLMPLDQSHVED